jgi:bifunctional UDP-N-acetylglucosamine pyrophosphorylase/glucosamine-1-phosphate N-acetyltransferase
MMNLYAVILAAGQGKRMKSKLYKVLHPVCGKPMVVHVLDALNEINPDQTIVVVGHGAEAVKGALGDRAEFALQEEQLGTGHAVLQAKDRLEGKEGLTLILYGDTPLVKPETLQKLMELHRSAGAAASVLTAEMDNPYGYGRIIRNEQGTVERIVEQKDCTPAENAIREINTGLYCFDNQKLFEALGRVTNDNAQQEYYLTDVIGILRSQGETVAAYCTDDPSEAIGVNDRVWLAEAERLMRERINRRHMMNGVTIIDPASTYIGADVTIGSDTVIYPGSHLKGRTVIGEQCVIGPNADIDRCVIGDQVTIRHSVLTEAVVGSETSVGPYAYLRPGSKLGKKVKVGDFVEIKNASLDEGTKVSHLSYVGDAVVGKNVNIGCGAITVNYDGVNKSVTEIADDAFIGSNVNLIAPVKIGKGAYVVAGSTITANVNDDEMAIARERQTNKPGYAKILRARAEARARNRINTP